MRKEASARILINKLLENSGWRFFDTHNLKANIQLEPNIKIKKSDVDQMGDNFEKTKNGFVDYLLLDEFNKAFLIVEAKKDDVHPLSGKEQARKYAESLGVKFIILSNGLIHYFWNINKGNPEIITTFPTYESLKGSKALNSDINDLINYKIDEYFIAKSQDPNLENNPYWKSNNNIKIKEYCKEKDLRILRDYQIKAVESIKTAIKNKSNRFLLEMATGTGKTLTAAAIIKLFLRTNIVNRVIFFVDRLELENQAEKDLKKYLSKDGIKVSIYKNSKDDWKNSDILISTIQSFVHNNKFLNEFTPSDFDLIISDEAHRSLGPSNKAIFEYFIGFKLGLTATPKNYLKGINFDKDDPREIESRTQLDTYHIFGCDSGVPTFSYTLNDGVKDDILVSPIVVDARSELTNELLSKNGLIIDIKDDRLQVEIRREGSDRFKKISEKDFEKTFFSENTNKVFCKTLIENSLRDPITNEIGKTIIFCVNINHARKITEILNNLALQYFPDKYNSDFAVQITSNINDAQQMTINFANNNLNGKTKWINGYNSSKTRIAVTVGMMTTGYDCTDILNIAFLRPVFSPSSFIQMKGRGTRIHNFKHDNIQIRKSNYKLFDFFAICEFFENGYNYNEKIKFSINEKDAEEALETKINLIVSNSNDKLKYLNENIIGSQGLKIDREFYKKFNNKILNDPKAIKLIESNNETGLESYLIEDIFDKPEEYYNLQKIGKSLGMDRKITAKELTLFLMGKIKSLKKKSELIDDEFNKFYLLNKYELSSHFDKIHSVEILFQAYLTDQNIRSSLKNGNYQFILNSQIGEDLRKSNEIILNGDKFIDHLVKYFEINELDLNIFQ